MMRYEDPADPHNGTAHHTGKPCITKGCGKPAGAAWSPYWRQTCNAERLNRVSSQLNEVLDQYDRGRAKATQGAQEGGK